jgi:O-Antigen ligase
MEVTPIGWILLVIGPLLMILRPKWLYIATIFFLPFTATDVINVGSDLNASGLQASMYLGSLLILRHVGGFLRRGTFPFPRSGRNSLVWLGVFIVVTMLSLIMPLWIDGRILIPSARFLDTTTEPLYLNSRNITGVLYMIYGYLLAYLTAVLNQKATMFRLSVKTFMSGSVFAAFWGILEFACKISGVTYPAMIFNTGTSLAAMGYQELLTGDVIRLSSVGVEPSIFAQTLLVALSLYLPFVFGAPILFGKALDRSLFALIFVVLCLTTSSTGFVGVFIVVVLVLTLLGIRGILRLRHLVMPLAVFAMMALLYASVPVAQQVLDTALFSKATDYSAFERLMTISNSYDMFLQYPVLGIGWASITSHDLIVKILANAGLLGLLSFTVAMYHIFRVLYRSIKSRSKSLRVPGLMWMDFALYITLGTTLATSVLSGFLNTFSFFWFVLGLAIAASNMDDLAQKSLYG